VLRKKKESFRCTASCSFKCTLYRNVPGPVWVGRCLVRQLQRVVFSRASICFR
jgi:hypothetical protein